MSTHSEQIRYLVFRGKKRASNPETGVPLHFKDWPDADLLQCGGPMINDRNGNTLYKLSRGKIYLFPKHVHDVLLRDHPVELEEIMAEVETPDGSTPAPLGEAFYDPTTFKRTGMRFFSDGAPQDEEKPPAAMTPEEEHQEAVDGASGFLQYRADMKTKFARQGLAEYAEQITNKTTREELNALVLKASEAG